MAETQEEARLWTEEEEKLIERACEQGLLCLDNWGAMPLTALESALKRQGFKDVVVTDQGLVSYASIAVWRLCRDKRIRAVSEKTIMLKNKAEIGYGPATQKVLQALKNFGGIATPENVISVMKPEGFGEKTVRNSIEELVDTGTAKYPFILSPNRRVWEPR